MEPENILKGRVAEADLDFGIKYSVLKNLEKLVEKYYLEGK